MTSSSFCFCTAHNVDLVSAFVHILGINGCILAANLIFLIPFASIFIVVIH
jgi:hypothetical protein